MATVKFWWNKMESFLIFLSKIACYVVDGKPTTCGKMCIDDKRCGNDVSDCLPDQGELI